MEEGQVFAHILQRLYKYSAHPAIKWESLTDYLESHEDYELQYYIMRCNPYVGLEETLEAHKSWRLELENKVYYLFCRDFGYQLGVETKEGIVSFSPPGEKETMQKLVALVQAKAKKAASVETLTKEKSERNEATFKAEASF